MEEARARIVASAVARLNLVPWATRTHATPAAALAPPVGDIPHAQWRGLPDDVVARVLVRLPVLDLFRLGYLFSPRWLDIWRANPLHLHDRQFASPRIAADDVADAIANVLELHVGDGVQFVGVQGGVGSDDDDDGDGGGGDEVVDEAAVQNAGVVDDSGPGVAVELEEGPEDEASGVEDESADQAGRHRPPSPGGIGADDGVISDDDLYGHDDIPAGGYEIGRVYSFRVETTRWRLDRWCTALQRGRVREVILANLAIEGHPDLSQGIRDYGTSLKGLHVSFFTVKADHIDPLVNLRGLGLCGCAINHGVISRALRPESEIRGLTVDFNRQLGDVSVQNTRLRSLEMFDNLMEGSTITVDDTIQFRNLDLYPTRPSRICIVDAPSLRRIGSLDLFNTVLEIKGVVIQAGMVQRPPKKCSVRILGLRVNYTEMGHRVPREIEQILKCFPCLEQLEIMRDDEVTQEERLLEADDEHIYQGNNFFRDLGCFKHHLRRIYLTGFRGGKYELALGKAILDEARAGTQFKMLLPLGSNTDNISNQQRWLIEHFRMNTPNDAVRDGHARSKFETAEREAAACSTRLRPVEISDSPERGMDNVRRSSVTSVMSGIGSSPAALTESTPRATLAPPSNRHADWRGLPDAAVARVLDRLPVLDLFRLGYLFSPRWLDIWRRLPLYLHDHQFAAPPIAADDVAQAITNVLELHVRNGVQFVPVQGGGGGGGGGGHGGNEVAARDGGGGDVSSDDEEYGIYDDVTANDDGGYEIGRVWCFRVETTPWRKGHLHRWCAALRRGRARVVVLANLYLLEHTRLPRALLDGTSLVALHLFYFTVEAYHIDRLRGLGLYGCVLEPGMIERVLHPESEIRELAIHSAMGGTIAVIAAAATRLRSLRMFNIQVGTVAVDDAVELRNLHMRDTRPSRIAINGAPRLRRIISLDIFHTVLEIQGIVIQAGMVEQPPEIRSVRHLGLRVNYTAMVDMLPRQIEQILRSFPRVKSLDIWRCDDVTQAEGLLQWDDVHYDGSNFFDGLESFNHHLRWIYLRGFRGGKCEVALMKIMLDKARVLTLLRMEYSPLPSSLIEHTLNQLDLSLRNFKLHTPNGAVRGDLVSFVAADASGSCVRLAAQG
uniref:F-box/LRR-repeat protein 15/At3g58940/PEG3-like LRR domain-containing protein n=2 Tax=Oryza glaberrima TaxID=4538 RepID=I1R7L3_ORYGL